jgi:integrase
LQRSMRGAYEREAPLWKNRGYKFRAAKALLLRSDLVISSASGPIIVRECDAFEFSKLLMYLDAACYIVIAGFTGLRISEISELSTKCLKVKTISGIRTLLLHGSTIKTAAGESELATWVAGIDDTDNPVKQAVHILAKLWARERRISDTSSLFVSRGHHKKRALVSDLTRNAAAWRLDEFIKIVPIPYSWHLSTHQFRKTFARYVATVDSLAIFALKRHFKHISIQMTDAYLGNAANDFDLFSLVLEAQEEHSRELLDLVLGSESLGGKLGEEIGRNNAQFRGIAGKDVRREYINDLVSNSDILIKPNAYGLCMFRRDVAACGGDIARVGVDTCMGCKNNIVAEPHRQYWKQREIDLTNFLDSLPSLWRTPDRERSLKDEIQEARSLLKRLGTR